MNKYMQIAKELADENLKSNNGGPFGACIVKDGNIVGKGANSVLQNNDPTAHAEIIAIRNACENLGTYDLTGCEIYTSCFPCPMCLSAIVWANIKTVFYGNTKEDADQIGFRDDNIYKLIDHLDKENNVLTLKGIDREETIKSFESFMNKKDKTFY